MYLNKIYNKKNILNHKVSKITDFVDDIIKDSIFVAIKGYNYNGINYIGEAISNGAKTIVYDQNINIDEFISNENISINFIKVIDSKVELAKLLKIFYNKKKYPKIIVVTGTNGKTSTTNYLYQILKKNNHNTLLIGTNYIYKFVDTNETMEKTKNTTLKITRIYELMFEKKYEYVIMEASSQGIEEGRLLGLLFDVVCFTNITQDHLDYHKTMDNYVHSKSKIIYSLKENGTLILNYDMAYFNYLKKISLKNTITYSLYNKEADYYMENFKSKIFKINSSIDNESNYIETNLIGSFNLENLLAAYCIFKSLNLNVLKFTKNTQFIKHVKGRMNLYKMNDFYVLIDFAHTPDGVYRVLNDFSTMNYNKIITVIGCGGCKDKEKRHIIGNYATKYSDYVIFTEDNSRSELIEDIVKDIIIDVKTDNYEIIYDRVFAIEKALLIAKKDDIILILGKGSEEFIVKNEIIKHSDIDFIENKGAIRLNG